MYLLTSTTLTQVSYVAIVLVTVLIAGDVQKTMSQRESLIW